MHMVGVLDFEPLTLILHSLISLPAGCIWKAKDSKHQITHPAQTDRHIRTCTRSCIYNSEIRIRMDSELHPALICLMR